MSQRSTWQGICAYGMCFGLMADKCVEYSGLWWTFGILCIGNFIVGVVRYYNERNL